MVILNKEVFWHYIKDKRSFRLFLHFGNSSIELALNLCFALGICLYFDDEDAIGIRLGLLLFTVRMSLNFPLTRKLSNYMCKSKKSKWTAGNREYEIWLSSSSFSLSFHLDDYGHSDFKGWSYTFWLDRLYGVKCKTDDSIADEVIKLPPFLYHNVEFNDYMLLVKSEHLTEYRAILGIKLWKLNTYLMHEVTPWNYVLEYYKHGHIDFTSFSRFELTEENAKQKAAERFLNETFESYNKYPMPEGKLGYHMVNDERYQV